MSVSLASIVLWVLKQRSLYCAQLQMLCYIYIKLLVEVPVFFTTCLYVSQSGKSGAHLLPYPWSCTF